MSFEHSCVYVYVHDL